MGKKPKYIGLGEYPSVFQIKKFRGQLTKWFEGKDIYIYFKTSKGIKRRKLFDNTKQ